MRVVKIVEQEKVRVLLEYDFLQFSFVSGRSVEVLF